MLRGQLHGQHAARGQSRREQGRAGVAVEGGVLGGREIRLLEQNDNSDPAQAAVVARKFVSQNVHLVLGGILDQEVFAVEPILGSSTLQMVTAAINADILSFLSSFSFPSSLLEGGLGRVFA